MKITRLFALVMLTLTAARAALAGPPLPLPVAGATTRATVDPRVRQYIMPTRIVWKSDDAKAIIENPEALLKPVTGQITLASRGGCKLTNKGAAPGILLDFGQELSGGVQIAVANTAKGQPVRLRVRFGESVMEAMSEVHGPKGATNDHAVRDQTCLVPWLGTHEIGNTGFRFVRIDLPDADSNVTIKSIRAVFIYRDLEYKGTFKCNDERLNRIWLTGAYTVQLNMQDYLWDGVKRDRLVWIGDMHPETMTIASVFGNVDIVPKSLDLIRDDTPLPGWMCGISSYSMWWVLIHHSWYRNHGDLEYLKQQKDYMVRLLDELTKHIGPDNKETLPEMRFLDWPSSENKPAIHAGLQSMMILTLQAGAEMMADMGDEPAQKKYLAVVERLRKHVPDPNNSKQGAALMALAGLGDAGELNRKFMAVDGSKRMSTFYGYYVLQARARAGDYQGCLDSIRQYWGAMIDLGATTFWEDFNLDWTENSGRIDELVPAGKKDIHGDFGNYCYRGFRHSLCHGWASGPTAWLSEHVLGIEILAPGCKTIRIRPHLGDLHWAEGTFPTPLGIVKVRHEKQVDGSVKTAVLEVPAGIKVVGE